MGVRGLQFYLEKCCPSASEIIEIEDLIQRNRHRGDQEIVIVVDGSSCIRHLYGNLEWVGGGQLKQFGDLARQFVQAFQEIGVRLVFFFDGPTMERKRVTWVERRYSSLDKAYYVLDHITAGRPSNTIDKKRYFMLPPGMGQLARVVLEVICGCEVHQSLTECDEEIADYARRNNVFAILGQDSDYVIFDVGHVFYLSMENLNLYTMTTRLYDRWELARHLNIRPSQLPLLATFMGNDIVTSEELQPFHRHIVRNRSRNPKDFKALIPSIALYIRNLPADRRQLHNILSDISHTVLGHPSRARDIRSSLDSYNPQPRRDNERANQVRNDPWSRLLREAREKHVRNKNPSMIYAIMSGLPYESSTSLEDFRVNDLPSFGEASQIIRQRIYGILLQEKPRPSPSPHVVREWCMAGLGSLEMAAEVEAVPPLRRHPGLMALWNGEDRSLESIRWQLFVSSVSSNLDVRRIRQLPAHLVIPVLILFFLYREHGYLENWEVEAMLATSVCLRHYNSTRLESLPSDPIITRGVRVANLIMRFTFVLYLLLAACGYPLGIRETAPWLFFDGKLFQRKYIDAMNRRSHLQLCDRQDSSFQDFQLAQGILFPNL